MAGFMRVARLLIAIALVGSVSAAEFGLRSRLEAQYAAMKAAMAARDANAISALLAPDFVSIDSSNQPKDADRMIQDVVSLPPDPNKESHTTLTHIVETGDTAAVDTRYEMTTKKTGPEGKVRDIKLTALSTDTWVHSNGLWRLKRTVTNEIDYQVDGQTVLHRVR